MRKARDTRGLNFIFGLIQTLSLVDNFFFLTSHINFGRKWRRGLA